MSAFHSPANQSFSTFPQVTRTSNEGGHNHSELGDTSFMSRNEQMQTENMVGSSENQFLFESQVQTGYENNTYLQQPTNYGPASGSTSMVGSMSPSTTQDPFSPGPYLSNSVSSDANQYSTAQLEQAMANAQFEQPLMNDYGQATGQYPAYSYDSGSYSDMMAAISPIANNSAPASNYSPSGVPSPMPVQHTSSNLSGTMAFSDPANRSPLMMNYQVFNNSGFQPGVALQRTHTNASSSDLSAPPARLLSPTVRIENCADGPNLSRSPSKRSHGSRRSNTHLSPYLDDECSDDGGDGHADSVPQPPAHSVAPSVSRNDDGSWMDYDQTGQAGVGPLERHTMNSHEIPTLDELEEQRQLAEKFAGVENWLTHSETGSDNGDAEGGNKTTQRKNSLLARPRAKSANDAALTKAAHSKFKFLNVPVHLPVAPGPGAVINEPSDFDEEEDDGSYFSESDVESITPPAEVHPFSGDDYFGAAGEDLALTKPWVDSDFPQDMALNRSQPYSSNAAIQRFRQRAKETDAASLTATVGSGRRRSESDIGSIVAASGVSRQILSPDGRGKPKESRRLGSFVGSILPNRNNSRKRKSNANNATPASSQGAAKDLTSSPAAPKRIGSFGKPKAPKLDTNLPVAGTEARSPSVSAVASATLARARSVIRSRSKSDLGKASKSPGLSDLLTQHGGLPVVTLASPSHPFGAQLELPIPNMDDESDDDDKGQDGTVMDLSIRLDMVVIPTYDGFKYQIKLLNPHIKDHLLEKLTQEQLKRYKRMIDLVAKHEDALARQQCGSKGFCVSMGGEPQTLPSKANGKNADSAPVIFQIVAPGTSEKDIEMNGDGQTVPAQFPQGVPNPPVKFLPAKFECPYCFKVKEFKKPSDWTKHVHEDVQPFTCTFANCNDAKSFKRKADWVRHENERHRQLEAWTCNIGECAHTCYRRDNFVQHLVREHKVPEPKVRTGRNAGTRSPATATDGERLQHGFTFPNGEESVEEYVAALVEQCRHDSSKQAQEEPCRFCGNICTTWKKLTVHLAKHMEQISMPVIALVDQRRLGSAETSFHPQWQRNVPRAFPSRLPAALPTFLYEEPSEMDSAPMMAMNNPASQIHLSYPPTNLTLGLENQFSASQNAFDPNFGFVGQSYPPLMVGTRPRASSFNDILSSNSSRQSTTLPPRLPSQASSFLGQFDQQQFYSSPMEPYDNRSMEGMGDVMFP